MSHPQPLAVPASDAPLPLLLIGFNRPAQMGGLLDHLAAIFRQPPPLYIALDGPRTNHPSDPEAVRQVRQIVRTHPFARNAQLLLRETNLGCRKAVTGAIDWFFSAVPEGIILEDDIRPSPDFFPFAKACLDRWRGEPRLGIVSAHSRYFFQSRKEDSYAFTSSAAIWGWAATRETWGLYDSTLGRVRDRLPEYRANLRRTRFGRYFDQMLQAVLDQRLDTWDVQLQVVLDLAGKLSIRPARNLAANTGASAPDATHTAAYDYESHTYAVASRLDFPLRHPPCLERDFRADCLYARRASGLLTRGLCALGPHLGRWPRLLRALDRLFHRLERILPALFRL